MKLKKTGTLLEMRMKTCSGAVRILRIKSLIDVSGSRQHNTESGGGEKKYEACTRLDYYTGYRSAEEDEEIYQGGKATGSGA